MGAMEKTVAARAFVRDLNILIRQVGLYGLAHKQVTRQYDLAWNELNKVLAEDGKLQVVAAGEQLLMDGTPLKAGSAERTLAQAFLAAGMAGLSLSSGLTSEEFGRMVLVFGKSKPAEILPTLKKEFGRGAHVKASGFQFVDDDRPAEGDGQGQGTGAEVAAALLGGTIAPGLASLNDPSKLLQLICAAQSPETAAVPPPAIDPENLPPLGEEDVSGVIHWLKQLAGGSGGQNGDEASGISVSGMRPPGFSSLTQGAVRSALTTALNDSNQGVPRPLLVKLAEHLAIRAAIQKYEKGESPFNTVQQTLERLKGEISVLHRMVRERNGDSPEASTAAIQAYNEELDRQFWAAVPGRNKLQVLLSSEAWCIPPKNIRSFLAELLERKGERVVDRILRNYCCFLESSEPEALARAAAGLAELADMFVTVGQDLVDFAIRWIDASLSNDSSSQLKADLGKAVVSLFKGADAAQNYAAMHKLLVSLERINRAELSGELRRQIQIENRVPEFVTEVLRVVNADLLEVLKRIPQATAPELAVRFGKATTRQECDRLKTLAQDLGLTIAEELQRSVLSSSDVRSAYALGLLTALDIKAVERVLPQRLRDWPSGLQAAAVQQIACSGAPGRGNLLLRLTDVLHPFVVPQALDEVGISGCAEVGALLHLAQGHGIAAAPYVQVKAIEAIGRLRTPVAISHLAELVSARSLWKWEYPQEIRIAALQALMRIDAASARQLLAKSGISETDLQFAPLGPGREGWVRHRRYVRVPIGKGLTATLAAGSESCSITLENMSLGGGIGAASVRSVLSGEGKLEVPMGLRRLQLDVLLCGPRPYQVAFEIASMDLDDRARLRKFLTVQAGTRS